MQFQSTMTAQTPGREVRLRVTTAGQFSPSHESRRATATAASPSTPPARPRKRRRVALRSARSFRPTLDEIMGQSYDPQSALVASVLDLIEDRFAPRQRKSLLTTIENALKLDAQGYRLQPLGQMRYRVTGGEEPYLYDHAIERCSCPLHASLGTCKHSIWAFLKVSQAAALMAPAPDGLEGDGEEIESFAPRPPMPKALDAASPRFRVFDEDGALAGEWGSREEAEKRADRFRQRALDFPCSGGLASRVRIEEALHAA